MAEAPDVVNRADALMKRRRSFVALPGGQSAAAQPVTAAEEDDLPVLTEVVAAEEFVAKPIAKRIDETQVSLLASEMSQAIQQQLIYELPTLIEAVLIGAGEELRAGITETMETAMRDFMSRRKQLRLPLDEPGEG